MHILWVTISVYRILILDWIEIKKMDCNSVVNGHCSKMIFNMVVNKSYRRNPALHDDQWIHVSHLGRLGRVAGNGGQVSADKNWDFGGGHEGNWELKRKSMRLGSENPLRSTMPPPSETGRSHEGHMKITCFKQGDIIIATAFLRHRDCIIFSWWYLTKLWIWQCSWEAQYRL